MSATKTVTVRNRSHRNYNGVRHGCETSIPEFELGAYLAAGFELVGERASAPESEAPQTAPGNESAPAPVNYSRLTRAQLTAELDARGIAYSEETVNKELVAILKASDEAPSAEKSETETEEKAETETEEVSEETSDEAPSA